MNPSTIYHAGTKYVSVDALRLACVDESVLVNVACLLKVAVDKRETIERALSIVLGGYATHISGEVEPIALSPSERADVARQLQKPVGQLADDSWQGARLIVEIKTVPEGTALRVRREGKTDHPVQGLYMRTIESAVTRALQEASTTVKTLGVVDKLEVEGNGPPGIDKCAFRRDEAPPARPPESGRN